jgi:hypothetical protein
MQNYDDIIKKQNIFLVIARLKEQQIISEDDPESVHAEADDILCDFLKNLGYEDIVIEYEKIDKWYS